MVPGKVVTMLAFVGFVYTTCFSQSIYQWRYDRSGTYPDTGLLTQWPVDGPTLLWSYENLPKGFSSPTVTPNRIFLTGLVDSLDVLVALSKEGVLKWSTPFGTYWQSSFSESRCTPTVEGDKVYVSSGNGDIACISAEDGKIIWK